MPDSDDQPGMDPRVYFAAERTLLAWLRTGLALMGFGFVVARFGIFLREVAFAHDLPPTTTHGISLWVGTMLVLLGVLVNIGAAWRYVAVLRDLRQGVFRTDRPSLLGLVVAMVLAFIGLGMAAYLVVAAR